MMKQQRTPAWWWVFPTTLAWMFVPILVGLFLPHPTAADKAADGLFYTTTRGLLWGLIALEVLSLVVPVVVITALGWWRRVHRDSVPTARWVIAVPVLMAVPALALTDYGSYAVEGTSFFALAVVAVLLIAASEELMFRGLTVEMLRGGMREPWVALLSTVIFSLAHVTSGSIPILISTLIGGYLYYLARRATRYLVVPILAHASFDLFGFSHWTAEGDAAFNMFVYQAVLLVVVLALTRFIPPASVRKQRRSRPAGP